MKIYEIIFGIILNRYYIRKNDKGIFNLKKRENDIRIAYSDIHTEATEHNGCEMSFEKFSSFNRIIIIHIKK